MVNTNFGLQNVVLSLQSNGTYKEYLVSYNLSRNQLKDFFNGKFYDLKRNIKITPINSNFSSLLEKVIYQDECVIIKEIENKCASGQHSWGEQCTFENPDDWPKPNTFTTELLNCNTAGTNSSPTNDGTGGGGTSDGSQVTTSPTTCKIGCIGAEDGSEDDEGCDKIKKYEEDTYIKKQLKTLDSIAKIDAVKIEIGAVLKNNSTGWGGSTVVGTQDNPYINFTLEAGVTIDVFMHTHFNGLLSIFSPGDLQMYFNILDSGASANGTNLVFMLVTNAGTKYAFSVNDIAKFNVFAQNYLADDKKLDSFAKNQFKKIKKNKSNDKNESAFLKMLKDTDAGVSLFKANNDFSQWQELTLNENNKVEPKDCD